jgi:hypothetical protein
LKLDEITNKREVTEKQNPNDEFYTPPYAIFPLIKYIKTGSNIWCPFDSKESNFVKLLSKNNNVVFSHIDEGTDFSYQKRQAERSILCPILLTLRKRKYLKNYLN